MIIPGFYWVRKQRRLHVAVGRWTVAYIYMFNTAFIIGAERSVCLSDYEVGDRIPSPEER